MRQFDFAPLYRSTVGFDRLAQLLDSAGGVEADGYPPYNIERLGDNEYRITMAVAGFAKDEFKIEVKESTLVVAGEKKARRQAARLPASRHRRAQSFERRFQLADHVEVKGAEFQRRPAAHRSRAQPARAHEAAHDLDRLGPPPGRSKPLRKTARLSKACRGQPRAAAAGTTAAALSVVAAAAAAVALTLVQRTEICEAR